MKRFASVFAVLLGCWGSQGAAVPTDSTVLQSPTVITGSAPAYSGREGTQEYDWSILVVPAIGVSMVQSGFLKITPTGPSTYSVSLTNDAGAASFVAARSSVGEILPAAGRDSNEYLLQRVLLSGYNLAASLMMNAPPTIHSSSNWVATSHAIWGTAVLRLNVTAVKASQSETDLSASGQATERQVNEGVVSTMVSDVQLRTIVLDHNLLAAAGREDDTFENRRGFASWTLVARHGDRKVIRNLRMPR
jgi:hypothetical protein